jgi:hypothetical protein
MTIEPARDEQKEGYKTEMMLVSVPLSFEERICPVCGAYFFGPQRAKYDSPACRARAKRASRKHRQPGAKARLQR